MSTPWGPNCKTSKWLKCTKRQNTVGEREFNKKLPCVISPTWNNLPPGTSRKTVQRGENESYNSTSSSCESPRHVKTIQPNYNQPVIQQRGERELIYHLLSCESPRHFNINKNHKTTTNTHEGRTTTHHHHTPPMKTKTTTIALRPYYNVMWSKMSLSTKHQNVTFYQNAKMHKT